MKSWTLTLWRMSKPMPIIVRWSVRLAYVVPLITCLVVGFLSPHFWWLFTGYVLGGIATVSRAAIRSWLRHYSVALVAKRRR